MKRLFIVCLVIFLIVLTFSANPQAIAEGTYTTNFPLTENPISENGSWTGGQTAGNNLWGNCQTNGGIVYGVSLPSQYGDPTAILTGSWGPNQTAQATVYNNVSGGSCCHEVELRLRNTISPSSITGYEINFSAISGSPYVQIVKWLGPNGSFSYLNWVNDGGGGSNNYAHSGDVIKATITGTTTTTITVFRNGTQIGHATDTSNPWTSGNPGIGFYDNQDYNWSYFGFSNFTATDGSKDTTAPSPPTDLRILQ